MPSRVEADLPDPEPSDSLETAVEIQNRVSEYDTRLPERIGRYRVERVLGKGGFGLVFLAYDEQLERHVAVKVPHAKLVSRPEDAEAYLTEARTVASLDHPHIVAVHDVGSSDEFPCYVVSKYIDGTDLFSRLKHSRLNLHEAVELVATVAEALHYAHKRGLVHRDIKPGNILIDKNGTAFVVDFGLALREQDLGKGPRYAGTPAYMSPEQARGEGHRVDGRSDIFSLAVVLYELLVGRRPFSEETSAELLEAITKHEPKPPRQIDDKIPKEVDRICLKALSKRASERYSSAKDMADDLRHFLTQNDRVTTSDVSPSMTPAVQPPSTVNGGDTPVTPISDSKPIKIVPKGLRSFDAHDADFFLELLPGPRDRDGLPDSLRFWKTRIEEADADSTFSVGLIYGPSGCGKSSLVKAGLLPRLSHNVIAIYVEATAEETETRLLNGLRKRCPALPDNLSLKQTLAVLRRGQGKKVVIILDQFEQWLHARKEEENTELVEALRQCDGGCLQCIVMVRDDFWMAATRFMRDLEVKLLEGQNSAAVDLFPIRHAEKVLAAFGRAFGVLPDNSSGATKDQKQFLERAVAGLAQEGKVISVRLALFGEMMKSKSWTPATLKEVGGTEGVGVTFLEETFSAATAPPEHRYHQKAARAVLKSLLPESGADIKGHMRSRADLLEASGYGSRPKDFDDLIRILDSEIRLITPTDPEGKDESSDTSQKAGEKYYQLTHDYLVPSLRDWLTRKKKETRPGRAELLLEDRAGVWNARPENRQLPSLWQWLTIQWFVPKKSWTPHQRKMMSRAGTYHAIRGMVAALLLTASGLTIGGIAWGVHQSNQRQKVENLVESMLATPAGAVEFYLEQLLDYQNLATPTLRKEFANEKRKDLQRVHAAYGLIRLDVAGIEELNFLLGSIPTLPKDEGSNLLKALARVHRTKPLNDLLGKRVDASNSDSARNRFLAVELSLEITDKAAVVCELKADPTPRTSLIRGFKEFPGDHLAAIARTMETTQDSDLRSALCAAVGTLGTEASEVTQATLKKLFEHAPDGGTHSAAEWALRQQGLDQAALLELAQATPSESQGQRDWRIINKVNITMLKIPSKKFAMGAVDDDKNPTGDEPAEEFAAFWMSDREVSVGQFHALLKKVDERVDLSNLHLPMAYVSWFDAVEFCNELSRADGLTEPYFYSLAAIKRDDKGFIKAAEVTDAAGKGYRLPTQKEWEYACRAMSTTDFSVGSDDSWLDEFAVYRTVAARVCGTKLPNGWGLFDMPGSAYEWCGDKYSASDSRVLRGGSFRDLPQYLRSAYRGGGARGYHGIDYGFRVSRTP